MKILGVVGARPNFMKIAPVFRALEHNPQKFKTLLVHTGQHYDERMSKIFFQDLRLSPPEINLGVGSGTHAEQTGKIMMKLEKVMLKEEPDLVMVVGDVNSTLAAAVTASKIHIPIAHVEAGLRSFDRRMPEEINRVVTDALSHYLFTPSRDANNNLHHEGIPEERIHFVGNVMIDSLRLCLNLARNSTIFKELGIDRNQYALLTLHRPSNVDSPQVLEEIMEALGEVQKAIPIIFPIHPRTENRIQEFGFSRRVEEMNGLRIIPPLGYLDFLALETNAKLVLTDSGGIQEETTVLGIPCLTLRESTERPITVEQGTNQIVGHSKDKIVENSLAILGGKVKNGKIPELWEGKAAERIVKVLVK
ncbi:MAG: UDP-N-acetylglucosamine 2-epimerase (non-hydrolyzing) [candidate division WOR-3 bacterium]|nr:UDP-N-acetylglucosamine 2-epimerase (non-hydrolyzing) [candidate division WOR-3 bacterium]